jgi:radical S-adenosyl methionine domain-containing protein 2
MGSTRPPSVNYHFCTACDMKCRYCFAGFCASGRRPVRLGESAALAVVAALSRRFEKVTFAGGEPTLSSHLPTLVSEGKRSGATTMVITNGASLLRNPRLLDQLAPFLDWIGLSIDSASPARHEAIGRAVGGVALSPEAYTRLAKAIRQRGIRLKMNTVVTRFNWDEDLVGFVATIGPERWKVFDVLAVPGQNDAGASSLKATASQYRQFVAGHTARLGELVVAEDNDLMRGSYAIVDPAGRFVDNSRGAYTFSRPILDVGVDEAFCQISFSSSLFHRRGGRWPWDASGLSRDMDDGRTA